MLHEPYGTSDSVPIVEHNVWCSTSYFAPLTDGYNDGIAQSHHSILKEHMFSLTGLSYPSTTRRQGY